MSSGRLALVSLAISVAAVVGYAALLGVPIVRNHPEGYVAAFAVATAVAGLALARRRRWYAWAALGVAVVLLALGAYTNFVVARIPPSPTPLRVGAPPPGFTLADAGGRPVTLEEYRGKKPVVLVFYRGYW
jgi:hypothetical protein